MILFTEVLRFFCLIHEDWKSLLLTGLVEFNSVALLAENLEMTSDNSGNCLAWAARDKSGFLSPYTFYRRYAYNRESQCFFLGN